MPRVLVVEDEPFIAWMIADWLTAQGHQVAGTAPTCSEAMRLVATEQLDMAIVDFVLADNTARCVISELKQRHIPFVLVTAAQPEGDDLSDTDVLSKPVDFDRLEESLARMAGARATSANNLSAAAP